MSLPQPVRWEIELVGEPDFTARGTVNAVLVFRVDGQIVTSDRVPLHDALARRHFAEHIAAAATAVAGDVGVDAEEVIRRLVDLFQDLIGRSRSSRARRPVSRSASNGDADGHLTDLGNSERLVQQHGQDLHRAFHTGWLVWTGTCWASDRSGEVMRRAKATVRSMYTMATDLMEQLGALRAGASKDVAAPSGSLEHRAEALVKWATQSEAEPRLRAMVTLAASEPGIPVLPDDLDRDPWLLNCRNGTLDLRTGQLRSHRREDLLTKEVEVAYDPSAECPLWEAFLHRIFVGNRAIIEFLQRAVGYALTGETGEQVLFLCYGTGANGKSSFLETLRSMLGPYARQLEFSALLVRRGDHIPNGIAALASARFVTAVEAGPGRALNEVVVKQLTGQDTVTARFLHKEFFEFGPAFKLFLAANHKPRVEGTEEAIWRRIRLIPFTVTIPPGERDKTLGSKLRSELPGILAWAVRGCLSWQRDGLSEPSEVLTATNAYREEMDVVGGFLETCCVRKPAAEAWASEIYAAYLDWARSGDEPPLSAKALSLRLTERGFERRKSNGRVRWVGLRVVVAAPMRVPGEDGEGFGH